MTEKIIKRRISAIFIFAVLITTNFSCKPNKSTPVVNSEISPAEAAEIVLSGEASYASSELSGLTWYRNQLILLPQYPFNIGNNGEGHIYKIDKSRLVDYIDSINTESIVPQKIKIVGNGLERFNKYGEGYESIAFVGDDVYLTIESMENSEMMGYVIKGKIDENATTIKLDAESLAPIKPQSEIYNLTDETILVYNNNIYTLYEANGRNINPEPAAHKFDADLKHFSRIKFPNVEYRITDASIPEKDGKFWVINYMYPGDWNDLNPAQDEEKIHIGDETHKIERLLEFEITDTSIIRTKTPPVIIKTNNGDEGRNWEGLAKLDKKGFIIVTDHFPRTILAFVENKEK